MNKRDFVKKVDAACRKIDDSPEHGRTAYADVVKMLLDERVLDTSDKIDDAVDTVFGHMSGPV